LGKAKAEQERLMAEAVVGAMAEAKVSHKKLIAQARAEQLLR